MWRILESAVQPCTNQQNNDMIGTSMNAPEASQNRKVQSSDSFSQVNPRKYFNIFDKKIDQPSQSLENCNQGGGGSGVRKRKRLTNAVQAKSKKCKISQGGVLNNSQGKITMYLERKLPEVLVVGERRKGKVQGFKRALIRSNVSLSQQ